MMAKRYFWIGNEYSSMEDVNSAIESKKAHIDSCPCDFVQVKTVSGSENEGWLIHPEKLTHEQLLAVTDEDPNFYAVSSIHNGDTAIGLTASEMLQEVSRLKRAWGAWVGLGTVCVVDDELDTEQTPEEVTIDVDMTGYV